MAQGGILIDEPAGMTIKQAYFETKRRLREAGVEDPAFEAACILEKHTGRKRHELALTGETMQHPEKIFSDVESRAKGDPLQ